jgi:ATP-binding cassette subfamily B protein
MLQVMQPVEQLGRAVQAVTQGLAMLDKMLELFREQIESCVPGERRSAAGPCRLEFDRVRVSYRSDRPILRDVSFVLEPGRTLGIVGTSGAGKSTIVRLLVRLIEPDRGCILLDGIPLSELPLSALRRAIAVVPQDTVLFDESIGYNIGFGKPDCSQEQIEEAARLAHLHRFVAALPEGYATRVGERGVKLSGGERQRISIARAALKRPRVYVFDEATSSLDSVTEQEILTNLRELSREATTLVIAHRLSTLMHVDQIAVLHDGVIVERGNHGTLLALDGRYATLWHAQQKDARNSVRATLAG